MVHFCESVENGINYYNMVSTFSESKEYNDSLLMLAYRQDSLNDAKMKIWIQRNGLPNITQLGGRSDAWFVVFPILGRVDTAFYNNVFYRTFEQQKDTALINRYLLLHENDKKYQEWSMVDQNNNIQRLVDTSNLILKNSTQKWGFPSLAQLGGDYELWYQPWIYMHFADTSFFTPLLREYIKQGKCPPEYLALMTDCRLIEGNGKYLYGVYNYKYENGMFRPATKEDYNLNINELRIAIGLPSMEMEKAFREAREK